MWAMTTIVKVALQKLEAAFAKNTDSSLEHTDIDTKTQSGCKAWHLCLFSLSVSFAASEPLSRLCSTLHVAILAIWEMCPGLQCMINLAHCPLELAWVSSTLTLRFLSTQTLQVIQRYKAGMFTQDNHTNWPSAVPEESPCSLPHQVQGHKACTQDDKLLRPWPWPVDT